MVRERVGLEPPRPLLADLREALRMLLVILGAMLGIGGFVTGSAAWVAGGAGAVVAGWLLRKLPTPA